MRLPKSRWVGIGVSLAVVAAAAGITLGVTTLLGVTFQGTGEAQTGGGSQLVEGGLLTANRDRLAICVQGVGVDPSVETKAKANIEAALVEVAQHPNWKLAGYGAPPPVVDIGCPSGPPRPVADKQKNSVITYGHIVPEPSVYKTFVFILPPQQLESLVGGLPRTAPQENICHFDSCTSTSEAIYVRSDEIQDIAFMAWLLEDGIGLESKRAFGAQRLAGYEVRQ